MNWSDIGIRGSNLGTKLDSLPYDDLWWCPGFVKPCVTNLKKISKWKLAICCAQINRNILIYFYWLTLMILCTIVQVMIF